MTRAKISEYSATANDNTDVNGINIAEGCPPSSMNNMGREIMAALKRFQVGSDGDGVTVGGNLVVSGSTSVNTFNVNVISEKTSATGVTIDGVLLKDSGVVTGAGTVSAPVYSTTGDTNTGIFFPAADTIAFAEGGAEAMRIDSSGNVGIGTSSPSQKLHIANTAGDAIAILQSNDSNIAGILFGDSSDSSRGSVYYDNTNESMQFRVNNQQEVMRIDSSGILMVGTTGLTNNGTRMSVSGANRVVRILGSTEGEGAFMVDKTTNTSTTSQVFIQFSINNQGTANGQINANGASQAAFGSFSDQRLKENIVDLPPQLANICALRPVEFDYIESEGGGHQIGFVAQNVQEIYPDLVGERSDGMLTLSGLNKNEARLVKAIQELKAELDTVKAELATLKG